MSFTLGELAERVGGRVAGDETVLITAVSTLQSAHATAIAFLSNRGYKKFLATTRAAAVILHEDDLDDCPVSALVTDQPYVAYARVAALLNPPPEFEPGVHPSAQIGNRVVIGEGACVGAHTVIEDDCEIGQGAYIGPGCVVGSGSEIGAGSRLTANVTVCHGCTIGDRALIHPGVVIGGDGFGIANEAGRWIKVPQLGGVRIGDDVEIGANTTIDRGALEDTVLEDGVKLDNQIQVAHNVHIGAHTAIAGCVGIAGSTRIGRHCAIGGGAGILGHLEIVDNVQITAMSLVTKSIREPGVYSSGTPLQPNELWHKNFARFRQLDEMARRLRALEKQIQQD